MVVRFFIFIVKSSFFPFRPARADESAGLFPLSKDDGHNHPAVHTPDENLPFLLRSGMSDIIEPELEWIVKRRNGRFERNAMTTLILFGFRIIPFEAWIEYIHN